MTCGFLILIFAKNSRPHGVRIKFKTVENKFQTLPVKADFLKEIRKNETSVSRQTLLQEVADLAEQLLSQTLGNYNYLCNGYHRGPGCRSFVHYVRFFLHVQLEHHPSKPNYCLVCGKEGVLCHFRAPQTNRYGGRGFIGKCKTAIDVTDPRLSNFYSKKLIKFIFFFVAE